MIDISRFICRDLDDVEKYFPSCFTKFTSFIFFSMVSLSILLDPSCIPVWNSNSAKNINKKTINHSQTIKHCSQKKDHHQFISFAVKPPVNSFKMLITIFRFVSADIDFIFVSNSLKRQMNTNKEHIEINRSIGWKRKIVWLRCK